MDKCATEIKQHHNVVKSRPRKEIMNKLIEFFGRGRKPDFDRELEKVIVKFDKNKDSDPALYTEISSNTSEILDTIKVWLLLPNQETDYSVHLDEMVRSVDTIHKLLKKTKLIQADKFQKFLGELRSIKRQFLSLGSKDLVDPGFPLESGQILPNYPQISAGYSYEYPNRMKDEFIGNLRRYASVLEKISAAVNVDKE